VRLGAIIGKPPLRRMPPHGHLVIVAMDWTLGEVPEPERRGGRGFRRAAFIPSLSFARPRSHARSTCARWRVGPPTDDYSLP
jgi:hypothetical protein